MIDNFVDCWTNFESVWIHLLANFTFESLPVKRPDILVLSAWWFFLFLSEDPTLQTLEVNETDGTLAFACNDEWVLLVIFVAPADSALDLVHILFFYIFGSSDFHGLSQFLLVQLLLRHAHLVTFEIFYSKSHSTELDGVELLDLVIVLPRFIFEGPSN